jgi:hypothetical protein
MKNKILILFTFLVVLASSCSKDFMAVNEVNPNTASSVAPKLMLPAIEVALAGNLNDPNNYEFVNLWYGAYSISSSYSPNAPLINYNITNTYYEGNWNTLYLQGSNLSVIIQNANTADLRPYRGIARTLKAMVFQYLVDTYGDVPYSEAFQTAKGILKPKYDKQQDIYEDLVNQLDSAINDFNTTPLSAVLPTPNQDVIYGQVAVDVDRDAYLDIWKRFANTLKLRILINQADMSGRSGYISSHLTNAIGYLGTGEGAMVNPGYLKSNGKQNPFYDQWFDPAGSKRDGGLNYYVAGQDILDFFSATSDPRIGLCFDPGASSGGAYVGAYYGQTADLPASGTMATVGLKRINKYDSPAPLFTDIESLFLQAEAAQRTLVAGDPEALSKAAIYASFDFLQGASTDADTFFINGENAGNPAVSYTAATDKMQYILTQKWASLVTIAPMTIWTDYRRTGFPLAGTNLHFSAKAIALGKLNPPVRLYYPSGEVSFNGDNESAAEAANGGTISLFTNKIFWQNR